MPILNMTGTLFTDKIRQQAISNSTAMAPTTKRRHHPISLMPAPWWTHGFPGKYLFPSSWLIAFCCSILGWESPLGKIVGVVTLLGALFVAFLLMTVKI